MALAWSMSGPAKAAERDDSVYQKAESYRSDALKLLERLVNIDSGTEDLAGINSVTSVVTDVLKQLGARVDDSPNTVGGGKNLVATFTGNGRGRILLVAHMDTVFGPGAARDRPFRIMNGRAYGPGVADDKGGTVIVLYALKLLHDLSFNNYAQLTLLLNSNEETGSAGSRQLMERLAKDHDIALNFEPGRPADGLVVWRKGSGTIKVDVRGRQAHAGVEPEKGRNAAMEMAHQMFELVKLEKPELGTTINVTVLSAGDRTNVIPDHATATADIRARIPEEFARVERDLARLTQNRSIPDTEVTATLVPVFPPMQQNARTDTLAARAQLIYSELGKRLTLEGTGGAADSSFTSGVGTPSLDGLGWVGGNTHSLDEYVDVEAVVPRLYLTARRLMALGASN